MKSSQRDSIRHTDVTVSCSDYSSASFDSSQAFLAFVSRAKAASLYDTGVEVTAKDHILTLITCDRDYHNPDGRLIVMAVKQ